MLYAMLTLLITQNSFAATTIKTDETSKMIICNAGIHRASAGADKVHIEYNPIDAKKEDKPLILSLQSNGEEFSTAFKEADIWRNRISSVQFDLSSQLYGTEYFVDYCYLGAKKTAPGNYAVNAAITSADMRSRDGYPSKSKLMVTFTTHCDLQDIKADATDPVFNDDKPNYTATSEFGHEGLKYNGIVNDEKNLVPRFCKLRALFSERPVGSVARVSSNSEFKIDFNILKN